MKTDQTKRFAKRLAIRVIIFMLIMIIISAVGHAMSPIISNDIALSQMQNSNENFMLMETYNKVHPLVNLTYVGFIIWFVYANCRDTYKFVKFINTKNEKEN